MNPRRLHALFNTYFRTTRKSPNQGADQAANINGKQTRYVNLDVPAGNEKSLSQYFRGG